MTTIVDTNGNEIKDGVKVKIRCLFVEDLTKSQKTDFFIDAFYTIKFDGVRGLKAIFEDFVKDEDKTIRNTPFMESLELEKGNFNLTTFSTHANTFKLEIAQKLKVDKKRKLNRKSGFVELVS